MVCTKYSGGSSHRHKTRRHRTKTHNGKRRTKCHCGLRSGKHRAKCSCRSRRGKSSRRRGKRSLVQRRGKRSKRRRQKGGEGCGACSPGQSGGNALGNAIVPGTIAALLAYFSGTKKRRHNQSKKSRR